MKKLRYLFLIIIMSFMSLSFVNAEVAPLPGSYNSSDISLSPIVEFYNSNRTLLSSGLGQTCPTCSPYFSSWIGSTDAYLSIGLTQALATDTLYTITLYIGNSDMAPIGSLSTVMSTGGYAEQANNNAKNNVCRTNIYSWKDTWNGDYYINMGENNVTTGMYFITFSTTCDSGTFINIPVHFGANTSHIYYYGYDLNVLGRTNNLTSSNVQDIINNSGLASANSVEEVKNSVQEVKQEMSSINDNITSDDVNGVENSFDSFEGFVSENSTITQLITMPITLYSSILNGMKSTCKPFVLGDLFGTNLTIPCINIGSYLGSALWGMIDIIISGFAIFSISKKLIKIFNNFSSMKEGDVIND